MLRSLLAISALLALTSTFSIGCAGCQFSPGPGPNQGDGGEQCAPAYEHTKALGCPPADPATGTWTAACMNARANGLTFHVTCFAGATTCDAVEKCGH
jgi:hypothetical protein